MNSRLRGEGGWERMGDFLIYFIFMSLSCSVLTGDSVTSEGESPIMYI